MSKPPFSECSKSRGPGVAFIVKLLHLILSMSINGKDSRPQLHQTSSSPVHASVWQIGESVALDVVEGGSRVEWIILWANNQDILSIGQKNTSRVDHLIWYWCGIKVDPWIGCMIKLLCSPSVWIASKHQEWILVDDQTRPITWPGKRSWPRWPGICGCVKNFRVKVINNVELVIVDLRSLIVVSEAELGEICPAVFSYVVFPACFVVWPTTCKNVVADIAEKDFKVGSSWRERSKSCRARPIWCVEFNSCFTISTNDECNTFPIWKWTVVIED